MTMRSRFPSILFVAILLLAIPLHAQAATSIGPADFEQIWLLNNQRNIIARYHQRTDLLRRDPRPLYQIDADSSTDQTIRTSAGDSDALLSRMGMHYQNDKYLFMLDWLSLIPQPQTTEGFTYGDVVLARSWKRGDTLGYTLGGRLQTRPNTTQVGGQTVFKLVDNASNDYLGGFAHITYQGWDFGTYYSRNDGNQANTLQYSIIDTDARSLYSTLTHLGGAPDRNVAPRNELAFNYRGQVVSHELRAGVTAAALSGSHHVEPGNAYLSVQSPSRFGFNYTAGLYFTRLIDTGETLRGGKLGVEYKIKLDGDFSMGLYARKNAFGDIDAMVVRNEPVYSFRLQGRAGF